MKYIVLRGLLPRNKAFVLQHTAETILEILAAAKIAEMARIAGAEAGGDDLAEIKDEIRARRAEVRQLSSRMDCMTTNVISQLSPSPTRSYLLKKDETGQLVPLSQYWRYIHAL